MRWVFIFGLLTVKICYRNFSAKPSQGFITVPASEKYSSTSLLEKIFIGSNYRKEWETPVKMVVFDIKKTNLRIVRLGGGQQTTSLELVDERGREWILRSVDKEVKPPEKFSGNNFIEWIIQGHISGSYPYAGLSVPDIANAAGVPSGEQCLFFVPDDSAFGQYRSVMANKVFVLVNYQPQGEQGITTTEMKEKLKLDKNYYVDQREYLKARLVDWLIADWDRHDDQWRWIERKTDSGISFQVVPRDRDQAFYQSNGLLVAFAAVFSMPHLDKFNKDARGIKGLSKKTWALDKRFTNQLKKDDWDMIIKEFQIKVTDQVIESAIRKQPPEVFAIRGKELIEKIKSRRDGLHKHVIEYYNFLQEYK